jgi:L-threonylcarbamoyladenylate synthase
MFASFQPTRHKAPEPCPENPPDPPFPKGGKGGFDGLTEFPRDIKDFKFGCKPLIWKVDPQHPEPRIIRFAGRLLSRGGVIVYPTETLYGLGGNPQLTEVVERIYRIKGRELSKPLPLIASSLDPVSQAIAEWPISAERLSRAFWPGPLTLVLRAAPHILPLIHGNTGKIAIRVSSHAVARALAAEAGGLLIATSANLAHQRPCQTPSEMPEEFLAQIDSLIDGGPSAGSSESLPSTIVDASGLAPRLIREGCIPWEKVLGAMS